jgi:hypothetical protein
MGYSSSFFDKAKVFKLLAVEGSSVLHTVERRRGFSQEVLLGKVSVGWLLVLGGFVIWGGEVGIREILQSWGVELLLLKDISIAMAGIWLLLNMEEAESLHYHIKRM